MFEASVTRMFSAAHAIRLPDGSLEPLHGHDWSVVVTVTTEQLDAIETVMDFHKLEQIVDQNLTTVHNRNLNEVPPFADDRGNLAINPTAERVAAWLANQVQTHLPPDIKLVSVRIGEAPGCYATYRPR